MKKATEAAKEGSFKVWLDNYKQDKKLSELIPLEEAFEIFIQADANNKITNLPPLFPANDRVGRLL